MGDEVLEGYAVQLQLVFEHYTDNEVCGEPAGARRRVRLSMWLCLCLCLAHGRAMKAGQRHKQGIWPACFTARNHLEARPLSTSYVCICCVSVYGNWCQMHNLVRVTKMHTEWSSQIVCVCVCVCM